MGVILAALFSRLGFSFISVFWKFYRNKGVPTRALMGLNGLPLVPWIPVLVYLLLTGIIVPSKTYLLYTLLWIFAIFGTQFLSIYLYKFQGLTVSDSFRTVFSTIVALGIDLVFFQDPMSLYIIAGCTLLLCSALILQFHKEEKKKVPLKEVLMILGLNCIIGAASVLELAFYKAGLETVNGDVMHHFIWSNTIISIVYILWGGKGLAENIYNKTISLKTVLAVVVIINVSLVAYTYAIGALPLVVMALIRVVGSGVFAIFDVKFKEFKLNKKTIVALVVVLLGLALITIGKMD